MTIKINQRIVIVEALIINLKTMNKLLQKGLINTLGVIAYVAIVVTLITNLGHIIEEDNPILAPITFLTLLVFSAAVTGGLVLGRPILMYLNDKKTEAIQLFLYTLGWLAIALVILIVINIAL